MCAGGFVAGNAAVAAAAVGLQVMKMLAESGPELLVELRAAEAAYNRSALHSTAAPRYSSSVTVTHVSNKEWGVDSWPSIVQLPRLANPTVRTGHGVVYQAPATHQS
jgi:predicted nucleotidyltransferase